ncbi:MAG TPA: glucosaminidase domain-containing protein, partial [Flavobacterium sp.]|nr:glucosaminidase domain-containing protein [Flavobacterium sp.]
STNRSVVRTTKPYQKPHTGVVRTTKPPYKKPAGTDRKVVQSPEVKKIEEKYEQAKVESKSNKVETVYSKTEILEATTRVKVTTAMVLDYIDSYKEIAKGNMSKFGIPASIILGQGILESGAGTGPLSAIANNHFGIKCHEDWIGESVKYDDDAAQECFRKYKQPSESYMDHAIFLTSRRWYASLFTLPKNDYKAWAKGLKAAGYATDPKYPDKLIAIIERYQLAKYDWEVLGTTFAPVTTTPTVGNTTPATINSAVDIKVPIAADGTMYQVCQGDTLYSISKKFNVAIDDLKHKNDIQDNTISIGQNLIIR